MDRLNSKNHGTERRLGSDDKQLCKEYIVKQSLGIVRRDNYL